MKRDTHVADNRARSVQHPNACCSNCGRTGLEFEKRDVVVIDGVSHPRFVSVCDCGQETAEVIMEVAPPNTNAKVAEAEAEIC